MTDSLLQRLLEGLRATGVAEWVAVATGVIYVLLIMRRRRLAWIAGGVSSLILAVLAARARLPMQALLQISYVLASVYGWWSWAPQTQPPRVSLWSGRGHVVVLASCVLLSFGLARLLAREGVSAYPFLDSLVTFTGLFATWLVARVHLENWLYWIVIDAVSIYLFYTQGLMLTALLFAVYLVIAMAGFHSWWNSWRAEPQAA